MAERQERERQVLLVDRHSIAIDLPVESVPVDDIVDRSHGAWHEAGNCLGGGWRRSGLPGAQDPKADCGVNQADFLRLAHAESARDSRPSGPMTANTIAAV